MIVDSSALLAVVFDQSDADRYSAAMLDADTPRMSVANWLESAMVVERRGDAIARARFDEIVAETGILLEPVSVRHAEIARQAWQRFGRGAHRAKLNFGNCLASGLAKSEGEPLLFKGNDFAHTDIEPALKD